ncbi:MAG: lysophospholipid acyltransferase family protein, partial [Solirubrobacteraceae bacterium]
FVRRRIQFMAKSQLFAPGPPQYIFSHGGVFPVRRGAQDDEAFKTAYTILERGGAVGMYCEGGRSRNGQVAAEARSGIGRLALESGAPVVPVAILGSHQVRNWKRLRFPRVTVRYGRPLRFDRLDEPTREQQQRAADLILDRIRTLHDELERLGHRGAHRAARRGEIE